MILFLKFLIAHLIGDFVLQPESWVQHKEKNKIKSSKLYIHIGVHAILLLLILQFDTEYLGGIFLILITHFLFDVAKIYLQNEKNKRWLFLLDQALHLLILTIATYIYKPFSTDLSDFFTEKNLLLLASILFVTYVSSVIIKIIITQWNPEVNEDTDESLAKAGRYIGILERLFVFIFVIANHWEGVGFLLAAKSVFRFGDLSSAKDRKLTEYILIGTLLSFALAIFTGMLYSHLVN